MDISKLKQVHLYYSSGNHYDSLRHIEDSFPDSAAEVFQVPKSSALDFDENKRGQSVDSGIVIELSAEGETEEDETTIEMESPSDGRCSVALGF